jgi:hypothetical protein
VSAEARSGLGSINLVLFSGLCLIVSFGWDLGYATIAGKVLGPDFAAPWYVVLVAAPLSLCVALGIATGQWTAGKIRPGTIRSRPVVRRRPNFDDACFHVVHVRRLQVLLRRLVR